jgi:hypothetical protein
LNGFLRIIIAPLFIAFLLIPHSAGHESIHINLSCKVSDNVQIGIGKLICSEMVDIAKRRFSEVTHSNSPSAKPLSLTVMIHNASKNSLELQLKWQSTTGQITEGTRMSVVMMDKNLNTANRDALYQRALAEIPLPHQK